MKKILAASIFLFAISCEDSEDEKSGPDLTGTYKLNKDYWDCDGKQDIIWMTIEKNTEVNTRVQIWDYMGDDCDDGSSCYQKEEVVNFSAEGNELIFVDNGEKLKISGNASAGGHITLTFPDGSSEKWDYFTSEVETYSPVCN